MIKTKRFKKTEKQTQNRYLKEDKEKGLKRYQESERVRKTK